MLGVVSLLNELRATADKIADAAGVEIPGADEVRPLLAALFAHLEQHVEHLGQVELAKVEGFIAPEQPIQAAPPPPTVEPPLSPATPVAPVAAPPVETPGVFPAQAAEPPADDEAAEASEVSDLKARIAQLEAEKATAEGSKAPGIVTDPQAAPDVPTAAEQAAATTPPIPGESTK